MRSKPHAIESLRTAIDCLPVRTRAAMLEGIRTNEIIVGAYTSRGGVCPMLAAHRNGGRTDFLSFAHAWDRFTVAKRSRRATGRELRILTTHLEASLLSEGVRAELTAAMEDHRELLRRHAHDPAGTVRAKRLIPRALRRGDYTRALERLEAAAEPEPQPADR